MGEIASDHSNKLSKRSFKMPKSSPGGFMKGQRADLRQSTHLPRRNIQFQQNEKMSSVRNKERDPIMDQSMKTKLHNYLNKRIYPGEKGISDKSSSFWVKNRSRTGGTTSIRTSIGSTTNTKLEQLRQEYRDTKARIK